LGGLAENDSELYIHSSIFSYANKILLLFLGLAYIYLIANLLAPSEYGTAMYILAFAGNLILLFGGGLGELPVVFTSKYKSKKLFKQVIFLALLLCMLIAMAFLLFPSRISLFVGKGTPEIFSAVALLFFVFPFFLFFEFLFRGLKSFGKIFKASFVHGISNLLFAYYFTAVLGMGITGLIYAKIIAVALGSVVYLVFYFRTKIPENDYPKQEIKRYFKSIFVADIEKKLSTQALLFYIGFFLTESVLGLYYIAEKIVSYLVEIPVLALTETMLPFISEKQSNKKYLERMTSLNIKFSLLLGLTFTFAIPVIGRPLLEFFFPQYIEAHVILPFFGLFFMGTSFQFLGNVYRSLNRTDMLMKSAFLSLVTTIVAGFFLIPAYLVVGVILTRILARLIAGIYLYNNQKKVGIKIEIIPRPKDLAFFFSLFKRIIHSKINAFYFFK